MYQQLDWERAFRQARVAPQDAKHTQRARLDTTGAPTAAMRTNRRSSAAQRGGAGPAKECDSRAGEAVASIKSPAPRIPGRLGIDDNDENARRESLIPGPSRKLHHARSRPPLHVTGLLKGYAARANILQDSSIRDLPALAEVFGGQESTLTSPRELIARYKVRARDSARQHSPYRKSTCSFSCFLRSAAWRQTLREVGAAGW